MPSTKEIKQKIKSTGNIKKIAKTMEMVSVSKMRKAVDRAVASRVYAKYALELLVNLSKHKDVTHPLMTERKGTPPAGGELLIVVAGNKGLCGGYNSQLQKSLNIYFKKASSTMLGTSESVRNIKAITVGKYGEKICRKLAVPIVASFNTFSEKSTTDETKILSDFAVGEFLKGEYKSAKILYTEFLKSTSYKPALRELFPVSVKSLANVLELIDVTVSDNTLVDYTFEPDINSIVDGILPGLVDTVVHQSLSEAFASEHSARMFAMKNAGDNAAGILSKLTLSYNRARQDGITRELSEIVAGAEALAVN